MNQAPNSKEPSKHQHRCRIVLTGGPGGGKTTAADLFRREIGEDVVIVPEAATMMFTGGLPRIDNAHAVQSAQRAIYHVQRNLEDIQSAQYPDRILLCDRGSIDGAAYWPGDTDSFFEDLGSSLDEELARYDGVIFFESAAVGGLDIEGGNPTRRESINEAAKLDKKLYQLWSQHPNFITVHHNQSFFQKISIGLAMLQEMVTNLQQQDTSRQ
ncbi:AAA family ATPase [Verrucomicrobiaceae bacterium R5-34]|uniref:AAA family ATPase n=1 Tax=Oceaniferula flava TaxID=2800421 RepID=A0AAE2VDF8_9BACT|nr:AAA family ATPase [Oceaniferula flavus]MBK1830773.1 AAA family ATPase [Verrucomicrobiaceae bacterium R5-34]MBK1856031.1 AAA family ATPase [Oceaniferula flavus]MBM1137338.1 AAA family ATPase [Oceaniferula flavus]